MKILTAAEMKQADAGSAASGVSLDQLMEAAGEAVARFCLRQYPQAARVLVLCGKGNNGGDGFVASRLLAGEGVGVRVLLAGRQQEVQGEAARALQRLRESTSEDIVEELSPQLAADAAALRALLEEADLILDAVVGTGFQPPLRGAAAQLRDAVASLKIPVVAVDLPSGWDADSHAEKAAQDNQGRPGAFRADAVVSFTAPKPAHVFGHLTTEIFAPVAIGDIGSPPAVVQSSGRLHWSGLAKQITEKPRPINSNKGKFGHVLIVGGSFGTAGAPSMASLACLRSGAGLVTAAVPRSIVNLVGSIAPELMVRPLTEDAQGVASTGSLQELEDLLKGIKVIAIGPGLSTRGEAAEFARELVARTTLPIVIDADALNAFAGDPGRLNGSSRTMVLTPHPGEFARLLGGTIPAVEADRVELARRFAMERKVTLVLKGWRTLIAHPDGSMAVNTSGNPGLAKGGSGDILTGVIAALLGQYPEEVAEAVEAAVFLHGLAADLAVLHRNEKTLLASDVIASLSAAFDYRTEDEDGLQWICGVRGARAEPGVLEYSAGGQEN